VGAHSAVGGVSKGVLFSASGMGSTNNI
jgi:hypothetical protein